MTFSNTAGSLIWSLAEIVNAVLLVLSVPLAALVVAVTIV